MDLKTKIEDKLESKDRNKSWLARQVGVSRQVLSAWLVKNKVPSNHLKKVAKALDCTTDWLLADYYATEVRSNQLSETEKMLLQKFRSLPKDLQERELTYLRGLVAKEADE